MPTLRDRITATYLRILGVDVPGKKTTVDEIPAPVSHPTDLAHKLGAERERRRVIETCRRMYREDPRAKGAIKALARDTVRGGFEVRVKNNPDAEDIAKSLHDRESLKLASRLDDWVRGAYIDGDTLLEVGVDEDEEIAIATRKPTLKMNRYSNAVDGFDDPRRAFWFATGPAALFAPEPPKDALWFAQWQIVHARWDHDSENRYGSPLFSSAISAYKRMQEGELDIAVRRKTRAGMKFLHVVRGVDAGALEEYKKLNKDALNNPFAATADFFTNTEGSISAIQGDARLAEIGDVVHHIETWWTASPVPMVLVGYGKDLNRDVLEQKLTQYVTSLEQITQWCEDEFVKPLLHLEWLLHGILPESLDYEITWKSKAPTSAKDLRDVSDAAVRLKALRMPDELVYNVIARYLPWLDLSTILDGQLPGDKTGTDDMPDRLSNAEANT